MIFSRICLPALYHNIFKYGIIFFAVHPYTARRKGAGKRMDVYFLEMVNSILASVIAYYICKWLDHRFK